MPSNVAWSSAARCEPLARARGFPHRGKGPRCSHFALEFMCALCRLLANNRDARLMWQTYCSDQKVQRNVFLLAVESFLKDQLGFTQRMLDELLSPSNRDALVKALDKDDNGKVRTGARSRSSFECQWLRCWAMQHFAAFADWSGRLELTR
jgi:hypothetical protein